MAMYRDHLPQLDGGLFLTDAGIETDLIFNHDIEIREFAAHTLLPDDQGRAALTRYFDGFLALARDAGSGFILDTQTWKAHSHWAEDLGETPAELHDANRAAVAFVSGLRADHSTNAGPIVLNGLIGPRGDAYAPEQEIAAGEAEAYHREQMGWLAETDVDMVTAMTFTQSDEATAGAAAYFMVNCAHPDHFAGALVDSDWARRIRGLRCNASRMSHAELDECEVLDDGDPVELGASYRRLRQEMPWLNVFGGCCGSDLRHVTEIARAVGAIPEAS